MDIREDLKLLKNPVNVCHLNNIKSRIFTKVKNLDVTISESAEPVPYNERFYGHRPIKTGSLWGKAFSCAWFHVTGIIPDKVKNYKLAVIFDNYAEGLIFDNNNETLVGISNPVSITSVAEVLNPPSGKTFMLIEDNNNAIDLWIDSGFNGYQGKEIGRAMLKKAELDIFNKDIYDLYFDFLAVLFAMETYSGELKENVQRITDRAYKEFREGRIINAREILYPVINTPSDNNLNITAIGHSHLDLAWLWPVRETKRKAARTLTNALANMDKYPEYIYGASQPQEFLWIKELYPSVLKKIKDAFSRGQFEPQGGMWVECDTNITGGESLIRQFMYGKKFWNDEFGFTVNNCWLPDVFGYSAVLPQIMKKCGIDFFMTQKLSWNEHNQFPLETFTWKGMSDDSVIVHLLPGNTYNSTCAAPSLVELYNNHRQKDKTDEALMLYGAGDGGGGPCQCNIELIKRYKNMKGLPKVNYGRACDFFERLRDIEDELPGYKGELYLEKHQGTYTTQSSTKFNNHECERRMHYLEAVAAAALQKGYKYPAEKTEKIWKEILLYQFHDILPGSSINRVYKESNARYKILLDEIAGETEKALSYFYSKNTVSALNLSPCKAKGYLKYSGSWFRYDLLPYSSGKIVKTDDDFSEMFSDGYIMENDILTLCFSPSGEIISLKDKKSGKQFAKKSLNTLSLYKDKKLFYNAWDIDINYIVQTPEKLVRYDFKAYTDGAAAVTENYYKFGSSEILQKVILEKGLPYVKFHTSVSWHETHKMLRADFIPEPFSDEVTCDIQFGNIKRSTKTDNKKDWAQFEICAHKFVDVSDGDYGSAVLSDSKYGFRVKDGLISLNLLRSPVYPDKNADRGYHEISYAYYPHLNDCFNASVPEYSYLFNMPVKVYENLAGFDSSIYSDCKNIIVETVKPSENGKGFIIRAYENAGKSVKASLKINNKYKKLYETDMLENIIHSSEEQLTFSPYEIKTLYAEV